MGLRQRLFARFYDRGQSRHERAVAERKRRLFSGLRGDVLELGPGTGVNLEYLDPSVRWTGVEPNEHMRTRLAARAERLVVEPRFLESAPGRLELDDASVDAVVSTLVLCSVADAAELVREVHRVLRPGGRFVFLEHVAAPRGSGLRRVQGWIAPAWSFLADGCRPDRELAGAIRAGGFRALEVEEFRIPRSVGWLVAPHVAGVATK